MAVFSSKAHLLSSAIAGIDVSQVSIAMTTYNGALFLPEQLASLAQQKLLPKEVVVCDDGSTDGTLAQLNGFAASAPFPVHVHRNSERLGYRRNFMKAASLCTADLVGFCDQDDIWHPDKIFKVVQAFDDPDVLLVHHKARLIDEQGERFADLAKGARHASEWKPLSLLPWKFPYGFTQTFRRSLLRFSSLRNLSIDFYDRTEPLAHDQWIFFLASSLGRTRYLKDALADYRQHGGNLFGFQPGDHRKQSRFQQILKLLQYVEINPSALADVMDKLSLVLTRIASEDSDEEVRVRAGEGRRRYAVLANMYLSRQRVYADPHIRSRIKAWRELVRAGAYGDGFWSFGRYSLVRDLIYGVAGARLHRHPTAKSGRDPSLRLNPSTR